MGGLKMVKEVNTEDLMDLGYQAEEEGNVEKAIYYSNFPHP